MNHELKRPIFEDFRVKRRPGYAPTETAQEFWES